MKDTIILTAIYREFWGTAEFRKSVERVGMEIYNVFPAGVPHRGNGFIYQYFYKAFLELRDKYKTVIYSDGADTFFQKAFTPPDDKIIYSAEKAIWPPIPRLINEYSNFYSDPRWSHFQLYPWRYLNGGNWCGPIELLIEWYEKYKLKDLTGDINGQLEQSEAFIQASYDGFPIEFDYQCKYFQTTAFEHVGDFALSQEDPRMLVNTITGSTPCVLHGNGRTDMKPIYDRYVN